jgi:hypothetical protein
MAKKKQVKTSKRERIDTASDQRYVRRDERGRFDDVVDVGSSAAQDQKRKAKSKSRKGQGDRGDR